MNTFWVMVIYFAAGHSSAFDTEIFRTRAECEAAKFAIVEMFKHSWRGPGGDNIACVEVPP